MGSEGESNQAASNSGITGSSNTSRALAFAKSEIFVAVILIVAGLISYGLSLLSPALLDEQFLLSWLGHLKQSQGSSSISGFFYWAGFNSYDQWGPLCHAVLVAFGLIFGSKMFAYKLFMLVLHCTSAGYVYKLARQMLTARPLALAAALLFMFYPLSAESVAWLGGIGSELSLLFFLISFSTYITFRNQPFAWFKLGLSLFFFALSLASSANAWLGALVILSFELVWQFMGDTTQQRKVDLSQLCISLLLYIVLAGTYIAACGCFSSVMLPHFEIKYLLDLVRDMMMPINQSIWHNYSKEYLRFYLLLVPTCISLGIGLWKNVQLRRNVLFCLLWLIIAVAPLVGHALTDPSLYGSRWLYFASVPLALLLAHACAGVSLSFNRFQKPALALSALLVLFFGIFYLGHLWNQTSFYRNNARILRSIQKSVVIANSKENLPFLILRDMPGRLSVEPVYSLPGPVCIDTATGLLRSNPIPDGRLKSVLREEKYLNCALRWESNLKSFIPLDLSPAKAIWNSNMTPLEISHRLQPGLVFYKTVSLDEKENSLVLETNSEQGPMITLTSMELSPIHGDYLVLEARIKAPSSVVAPRIELHWQTRVHEDFEKKERFTYTPAVCNDGQYHKYYLSTRSNGWTTSGSPKVITLGFPAGARVDLRQIAVLEEAHNMAKLTPLEASPVSLPSSRYTPPYYDYPTVPELGLFALPDTAESIVAKYSTSEIPEASSALLEISRPNESFDDANSDHLSGQSYKTVRLTGTQGELKIAVSDLMGPGVYSIRVIALAADGSYRGTFSDPLCYQVPLKSFRH